MRSCDENKGIQDLVWVLVSVTTVSLVVRSEPKDECCKERQSDFPTDDFELLVVGGALAAGGGMDLLEAGWDDGGGKGTGIGIGCGGAGLEAAGVGIRGTIWDVTGVDVGTRICGGTGGAEGEGMGTGTAFTIMGSAAGDTVDASVTRINLTTCEEGNQPLCCDIKFRP